MEIVMQMKMRGFRERQREGGGEKNLGDCAFGRDGRPMGSGEPFVLQSGDGDHRPYQADI